jgi:hypothetical protein
MLGLMTGVQAYSHEPARGGKTMWVHRLGVMMCACQDLQDGMRMSGLIKGAWQDLQDGVRMQLYAELCAPARICRVVRAW